MLTPRILCRLVLVVAMLTTTACANQRARDAQAPEITQQQELNRIAEIEAQAAAYQAELREKEKSRIQAADAIQQQRQTASNKRRQEQLQIRQDRENRTGNLTSPQIAASNNSSGRVSQTSPSASTVTPNRTVPSAAAPIPGPPPPSAAPQQANTAQPSRTAAPSQSSNLQIRHERARKLGRISELEAEIAKLQAEASSNESASVAYRSAIAAAEELLVALNEEQQKYDNSNLDSNAAPIDPLDKDLLYELEGRKDSFTREATSALQ